MIATTFTLGLGNSGGVFAPGLFVVTVSDIDHHVNGRLDKQLTVAEIGTPRHKLVSAYPDETIGDALQKMSPRGLGHLPVIDHENPDKLLGFIRRSDIIRAYDMALVRRAELQHRTKRTQIGNLDNTEFVDFVLSDGATAAGKKN